MQGRTIVPAVAVIAIATVAVAFLGDYGRAPGDGANESYVLIRSVGTFNDVRIDNAEMPPAALFRIADEICGALHRCQVRYWPADAVAADQTPPLHGEIALYDRNRGEGIDILLQDGREIRR